MSVKAFKRLTMKRKAPPSRSGSKTENVLVDLSDSQLRLIGAVAIQWNEIEFMIDCAAYSLLELKSDFWLEIVTRIRTDEKRELLKSAIEKQKFPQHISKAILNTLNSCKELQELRNSVVHARVFNAGFAIGETVKRSGVFETLISEEALRGLYGRLEIYYKETRTIIALFDVIKSLRWFAAAKKLDLESQIATSEDVNRWLGSLNALQEERMALPSLPSF